MPAEDRFDCIIVDARSAIGVDWQRDVDSIDLFHFADAAPRT